LQLSGALENIQKQLKGESISASVKLPELTTLSAHMQPNDLKTFVIRKAMGDVYSAMKKSGPGVYLSGASGQGKSFIVYLMALLCFAEQKFTLYIVSNFFSYFF